MDSFAINEFYGIEQQRDGNVLPVGSASDARNMETRDGDLAVAAGYEKLVATAIPGTDRLIKVIPVRGYPGKYYVVGQTAVYACNDGAWSTVHTFSPALSGTAVDYLQTKIGTAECVLIATGEGQIVRIELATDEAGNFGSGAYILETSVSAYDTGTRTVTLAAQMSEEAQRRALVDGLYFGGSWCAVSSCPSATTLILQSTPATAPKAGDAAKIRGGGSDVAVRYLDSYYGRLIAAGDPEARSRLYWSAVPGDGRTIEDWLSVDAGADASGGYVEVGEADGDEIVGLCALSNQVVIFKRYSVWRLYGDRPSTFAVERIDRDFAQMADSSVVVLYDQPFFLTKNGLMYYNGSAVAPVDGGTPRLHRFLSGVRSVADSRGVAVQNRFYFSCRTGEGDYDDAIVQYDVHRQAYMVRDGFAVADLAAHDGVVLLLTDARYLYRFESGETYDGAPIRAYWVTQPSDLGLKAYKKQIGRIILRAEGRSIIVRIQSNALERVIQRVIHEDDEGYMQLPVAIDQVRRFWVRFENEAGRYFAVRGGVDIALMKEMK